MNGKEDLIDFNSPKLLNLDAVKYCKSNSLGINEGNKENSLNTGNNVVHLDNTFNLIEFTENSMFDGKNNEEQLQLSNIINVSDEICDTTNNCSSITAVHSNNSTIETEQHFGLSTLKNNSLIDDSNIVAFTNQTEENIDMSVQEAMEVDRSFIENEVNYDSEALMSIGLDIEIAAENSDTLNSTLNETNELFVSFKVDKENITNTEKEVVDNDILLNKYSMNSPSKLNSTEVNCHSSKKEIINEKSMEEINSLKELLLQLGNENKELQENNLKYFQELQNKSELLLKQSTVVQSLGKENDDLIQEKQKLTEQKQNLSQELQSLFEESKKISGEKHILMEGNEKLLQDKRTLEESKLKLEEEVVSQNLKIQKLIEENEELVKKTQSITENNEKLFQDLQILLKEQENKNQENKLEINYQQELQHLSDKLQSEKANTQKYCIALRNYEDYFNGLYEKYAELQRQNEQKNNDLAILETAFRNTVEKYEKCKVLIDGYKTNEVIYQDNIKKLKDKLIEEHGRFNTLKEHVTKQFQDANKSTAEYRNKSEEATKKQNANLKRLEIKLFSLQELLQQKVVECERLAKLYDEITSGKV